jgi:hypothetical protein
VLRIAAAETVVDPELARELTDVAMFAYPDERDPDPFPASAAGASDAMDVSVTVRRGIEVDHVRDPSHVDPAGGNIGGDKCVDRTGLEPGQRLLALALGLVAVHRQRRNSVSGEALHESLRSALGAHEYERELTVATELTDERLDPTLSRHLDEPVLDL